jgi:hypothetical protein
MSIFGKLVVAGVGVFAILQLVRPGIPFKPATAGLQAPPEIENILEKDCYSCHSDQGRLAWFDRIVPGYWLVRHDILAARERLNFSTLGSRPAAVQKAALYEGVNMIALGAMPLPDFVWLHPEAKVTPQELTSLKSYLAPWTSALPQSGAVPESGEVPAGASLAAVRPELNGLSFDPTFESWKPISVTDRGDNNSFRFVLANGVALKAAQSGNISPWPDGSRFAKIAWQQEQGRDGLVQPGKFIQVELMVKDAQRYKQTEGWGWGRWRSPDLKPYGEDSHFVNECTGCHQPLRGNDYVYTLPITTAKVPGDEVVNNTAAALPQSLPYQPLGWSAITMYVDPRTHTMSTLYGNDSAMQTVQTKRQAYAAGAVLALVTWVQRDDPHWFGARIPNAPESIEFVEVAGAGRTSAYRRFAGSGLTEDHLAPSTSEHRTSFLLGLAPAWLP